MWVRGSGKDTGNLPLGKLKIMRHSSSSVENYMGLIDYQSGFCTALSAGRKLLFSFAWGREGEALFHLILVYTCWIDRGKLASDVSGTTQVREEFVPGLIEKEQL